MKKRITIIGSGFSSLAASCYLAKAGIEVTVLEKNKKPLVGARQFKKTDLRSTWALLGIGYPMYLNVSLEILQKNPEWLLCTGKIESCL